MSIELTLEVIKRRGAVTQRLISALGHLPINQQIDIVASYIPLDELEEMTDYPETTTKVERRSSLPYMVQTREETMDTVRFTIPARRMFGKGYKIEQYKAILRDTLGVTAAELEVHYQRNMTVEARLDQFARFLIHRHACGLQNGFAELEPKLISEERPVGITKVYDR